MQIDVINKAEKNRNQMCYFSLSACFDTSILSNDSTISHCWYWLIDLICQTVKSKKNTKHDNNKAMFTVFLWDRLRIYWIKSQCSMTEWWFCHLE